MHLKKTQIEICLTPVFRPRTCCIALNDILRAAGEISSDLYCRLKRQLVVRFYKRLFCFGVGKRPPIYFFDKMHTTIH